MAYPDSPEQRVYIIVNNMEYDLSERFGMMLMDGFEENPPEPKFNLIDIPSADGKIDITESLYGDVPYTNRHFRFTFLVINPENVKECKRTIINVLHGKRLDFKLSWDKDFTYNGRFNIKSTKIIDYAYPDKVCFFEIEVDANPYKYSDPITLKVDTIGGIEVILDNGRKRTKPVIETPGYLKIIYNDKEYEINSGSWKLHDLILLEGYNTIYFRSVLINALFWNTLKKGNITWGEFKTKKLYEWYSYGDIDNANEFAKKDIDNVNEDNNYATNNKTLVRIFTVWSDLYPSNINNILGYGTWKYLMSKDETSGKNRKWSDLFYRFSYESEESISQKYEGPTFIQYKKGEL